MNVSPLWVRRVVVWTLVVPVAGLMAGCQNLDQVQNGALLGSALGAGTGAIIGHQSGHRDKGALVGALSGGVLGAMYGKTKQAEEERDAAVRYAHHVEETQKADARAVTNREVIAMTQKGLSDMLIMSTIQNRGGKFDTSPNAVIYLKENGVSDNVIQAMQQHDRVR